MSVESAEARPGQQVLEVAHPEAASARDHECQDRLASSSVGNRREATDDLPALCVPDAAGAASIGTLAAYGWLDHANRVRLLEPAAPLRNRHVHV